MAGAPALSSIRLGVLDFWPAAIRLAERTTEIKTNGRDSKSLFITYLLVYLPATARRTPCRTAQGALMLSAASLLARTSLLLTPTITPAERNEAGQKIIVKPALVSNGL